MANVLADEKKQEGDYFEGHACPLAKFGHSRDERRQNPQIIFGALSKGGGLSGGGGGSLLVGA